MDDVDNPLLDAWGPISERIKERAEKEGMSYYASAEFKRIMKAYETLEQFLRERD